MPVELIWRPQAREDLLDIYVYIGVDNADAAERLYDAIEVAVNHLAKHPRLGARRTIIFSSARILIEGAYLILYETHPDTDEGPVSQVEIVRVVDGRRDLTRPF
ncbi:MAG TPA: type II toxin-antitoxin system RelE/ParE family toxin [Acidobacteriaceae bacterium]